MDFALLAATALGAVALYLMLPREKAPLVKLGGLLGVMSLAGLLLYLVRTVAASGATGAGPSPYFYAFAVIMIASAVGVVAQPKPVYAALYFVLLTLAGAGIFVLLLAEFMAVVLIIIYGGAILVTYVFVIMLASQASSGGVPGAENKAAVYDRRASEPFVAVLVSFVLLGVVLQVLYPVDGASIAKSQATDRPDPWMSASLGVAIPEGVTPATMPATQPTNIQMLGTSLYGQYALSLELAGVLLTIALIGAVVIARKNVSVDAPVGTGKLPSE